KETRKRRLLSGECRSGPPPLHSPLPPAVPAADPAMAPGRDRERWIATRMRQIESSGIRKVFELARSLKDPVNLSIGQPDFDVPEPIKAAAPAAIDGGANGYTLTQGIPELRGKIQDAVRRRYQHPDREVFITSGTSGGL